MKILHTSDWHFGASMAGSRMDEDHKYFLEQLYSIIKSEGIELVICAGDVFDSSITNATAIDMYNSAVTKICSELGSKMVIIAGNHDSSSRLSTCNELLRNSGLYILGRISKDLKPTLFEDGKVAIYSVPFFNRDEVIAMYPERKGEIKSQEMATKVYFDAIRESLDKGRKNIVVSHSFIVDSEISESDKAAQVGNATAVSKDVFEGFDYVALGHIHKPQIIEERIRYSGSPVKMSFGKEEDQTKVVFIYDTETDEVKEIPLTQKHEWKTVECTYDELMSSDDLNNMYLRVRLTDRPAGAETHFIIKDKFPLMLELKGRSFTADGEETSFSLGEFEKMSEEEILLHFLNDKHSYMPAEEQLIMFREALAETEEEEE